jgi:putative copper export protein
MSLYYLNVIVHLLAALFWLGGMFFLALVGAPVLRRVEPPELRARLFQALGESFRFSGWIAIGVLLITGAANLHFKGILSVEVLSSAGLWDGAYGRALLWKLLAVSGMVVVSFIHDFVLGPRSTRAKQDSPQTLRLRKRAASLARLNALLGIVAVVAAVYLARGTP